VDYDTPYPSRRLSATTGQRAEASHPADETTGSKPATKLYDATTHFA
jgi:hypothetical protein